MTIFPFQLKEMISKLKPSMIIEKDEEGSKDAVNISAEAKKRQIFEQARSEVLERIRETKQG